MLVLVLFNLIKSYCIYYIVVGELVLLLAHIPKIFLEEHSIPSKP
jgi:hypothetical protein